MHTSGEKEERGRKYVEVIRICIVYVMTGGGREERRAGSR